MTVPELVSVSPAWITPIYLGLLDQSGQEDFGINYRRLPLPKPILTLSHAGQFAMTFAEQFEFNIVGNKGTQIYAGLFDAETDGHLLSAHDVTVAYEIVGAQNVLFRPYGICFEMPNVPFHQTIKSQKPDFLQITRDFS